MKDNFSNQAAAYAQLNSWSSIQHYKKANNGSSPIFELMLDMSATWGEFERQWVHFPVFINVGRVLKT